MDNIVMEYVTVLGVNAFSCPQVPNACAIMLG